MLIGGAIYYRKRAIRDGYHPNLFPPSKRPNDPFVIDSSDDPRLRIGPSRPIYQEEMTATSLHDRQLQQQQADRHISGGTTLMGSEVEEGKDALGKLGTTPGNRHISLESNFTSFSTTTTKPDLSEPQTPIERIKPDDGVLHS